MIIDCHGHYTTAPKELEAYREKPDRRHHGADPSSRQR